ncbi:hypothetical protein GE061_000134 [Apolygus lucorum]|uniref:Phosphoribosylaminoimidazolesuccinocarboxamide synthase n=1 Tax=Apolygus lucorum TaxID=248454 RepID=A0A8S9Y4X8_APOLU|nr:hypothetical protein GE061_000134 [Apolygus lucorum]
MTNPELDHTRGPHHTPSRFALPDLIQVYYLHSITNMGSLRLATTLIWALFLTGLHEVVHSKRIRTMYPPNDPILRTMVDFPTYAELMSDVWTGNFDMYRKACFFWLYFFKDMPCELTTAYPVKEQHMWDLWMAYTNQVPHYYWRTKDGEIEAKLETRKLRGCGGGLQFLGISCSSKSRLAPPASVAGGAHQYGDDEMTRRPDDANHDPQWSEHQIIAANFKLNGITITRHEVDIMRRTAVTVFEVLEKAWASRNCALIDMKIEFGVDSNGDILVSDIIDSDSWRLWPSGDKRLMKDKQVYRNLTNVTAQDLETIKSNFQWIADQLDHFCETSQGLAVILMGSPSDEEHARKIEKTCQIIGLSCELRVTSAHKGTDEKKNKKKKKKKTTIWSSRAN